MTGDFGPSQPWAAAIGLAFVAYFLSWVGVKAMRRIAERRNLLDIPNERSSHTLPTPRGGGLAIVAVTVTLSAFLAWFLRESQWLPVIITLGAWIAVAGVSFADDIHTLPIGIRFAAHALAALAIIVAMGHWGGVALPLVGEVRFGILGVFIAFVWLVGLTNAYNFMDGIDGIAGSQAVVAGLVWAVAGAMAGAQWLAAVGLIIAAASFGFLQHNWAPARIFMGDVGSAFLGLGLATLAVAAAEVDPRLAFVGVLAVWPFVFDASFTFVRRALRGENVLAAHRSHLYQRLVILGYGHARVTIVYALLAAMGGLLALLWLRGVGAAAILIPILIPAAAGGLWYYVVAQERVRESLVSKRV